MKISIVSGTCNRLPHLKAMVDSVRGIILGDYEFVIVDAGSSDGTEEWCKRQPDIVFIQQGERLGAVKAFNAGFVKATGDFCVNLNDDAIVVGDVFTQSIRQMQNDNKIGQVAFPFTDIGIEKPGFDRIYAGSLRRGILYSNFGMTRRWLGERVGWWGNIYLHYAGDAELSMRIIEMGYKVVELSGDGYIKHLHANDSTRIYVNTDSPKFYQKWMGWSGPPRQ